MSSPRFAQLAPTLFITALAAAGCANNKRIDEGPITIMRNGDRVDATPVRAIDAATTQSLDTGNAGHERRHYIAAVALAS